MTTVRDLGLTPSQIEQIQRGEPIELPLEAFNKIDSAPPLHESLSEAVSAKLRHAYRMAAHYITDETMERWEASFLCNRDPAREADTWTSIADAVLVYTQLHNRNQKLDAELGKTVTAMLCLMSLGHTKYKGSKRRIWRQCVECWKAVEGKVFLVGFAIGSLERFRTHDS